MVIFLPNIVRSDGSLDLSSLPDDKNTQYINITGQDGSGKSSLVDGLADHYDQQGYLVITSKSPCDPHLTDLLYNAISQDGYEDWYTEQLLFSFSDGLLSNYMIQLDGHCDYFICHRGPADQYNSGVTRSNLSYKDINKSQKPERLAKFDIYFHLNCDGKVSWERVRDNPNKYQYPAYLYEEAQNTERLPMEIVNGNDPSLKFLRDAQHYYINTTELGIYDTFRKALKCLGER